MYNKNIFFRPKGALIVFGHCIAFPIFLGAIIFGIYIAATERLELIEYLIIALGIAILLAIMAFLLREIIAYKVVLTTKEIKIPQDRAWLILRHKAITLSYEGLKSLQYCQGITAGNREEPFLIIMAVVFEYADGKETMINLNRFSQKQIKRIMGAIKDICKEYYDTEIEIKPDLLPRKKVKR